MHLYVHTNNNNMTSLVNSFFCQDCLFWLISETARLFDGTQNRIFFVKCHAGKVAYLSLLSK